MVGSFSPLVIAVSQAGGLGSIACAALSPARLREEIRLIRAATSAPFNVNFFCHVPPIADEAAETQWHQMLAPYYREAGIDVSEMHRGASRAPFDNAMCELIEEIKPPVVSFHFGLPNEELLARVRSTGAMVLSSATTVEEALWLEEHGADAIIAQGAEAGGHRGMFLTEDIDAQPGLFALLPQIVDAVNVPVIAAGAIADGRGVAAAFLLGASAVQVGTAYLMTPQASRSGIHRAALRDARDDTTRLTNLYTGRPARGILTRFMREQGPMSSKAPSFPLAAGAVDPLRSAFEEMGRSDFSLLWSGEAAALAREEDAGLLTQRLWDEAEKCASNLSFLQRP